MIIASKVHFFTILQVLKVFKPDFCQTSDLRSQTWLSYSHTPLLTPTTSLSSLILVVFECGRILSRDVKKAVKNMLWFCCHRPLVDTVRATG